MDARTRRIRLNKKRRRHEMTKKRGRKHKMNEANYHARREISLQDSPNLDTTSLAFLTALALRKRRP